MKIRKLRFKNINSLKDEQEIDFEINPLKSAGIILIAGPTGSGKSTILDVITLALYNEIPRFGKGTLSNVKDLGSILTHHTRDAYAEVYYSANGVEYVSKWSIEVNRNQNLNDYHMEITNISSGNLLTQKRSEVPDANASIIGLNYNQFIKSILLSQGEFAQFLRASHEQRSELLEKITGTEIYRKLGKAAFEKHKASFEKLNQAKSILQQINLFTEEQIKEKNDEQKSLEENLKTVTQQLLSMNDAKLKKESYKKAKDNMAVLVEKIEDTKKSIAAFSLKKKRLELHENLNKIRGDLAIYKKYSDEQIQNINRGKSIKEDVAELTLKKQEAIVMFCALSKKEITEDNFLSELSFFDSTLKVLEDDLARLQTEGRSVRIETESLLQNINQQYKNWYVDRIDPKDAIINIDKELSEASQLLIKYKVDVKISLQEINHSNNQLNGRLRKLDELDLIIKEKEKENKTLSELNNNEVIQKKFQEEAEKEILKNKEALKDLQDRLVKSRMEKDHHMKMSKLSEMREQLVDGEPCPLCGAVHHPYHDAQVLINIGKIELGINQIEEGINNCQGLLLKKSQELASIQTTLKEIIKNKLKCDEKIAQLSINEKSIISDGVSEQNIENQKTELQNKIDHNNSILYALDKTKVLQPLRDRYTQMQNIRIEFLQKSDEKFKLTDEDEPLKKSHFIGENYKQTQDEIRLKNQALESSRSVHLDIEKKIGEIESKLQKEINDLGLKNVMEAHASLLDDGEYAEIKEEHEFLNKKQTELNTQYIALNKELKTFNSNELEAINIEDIIENIYKLNNQRDENNRTFGILSEQLRLNLDNEKKSKKLIHEITLLDKEHKKWELLKNFIGDREGKNFANYAQELTLLQIIELANLRLKELTDRYLITQKNNDLFVIDLYLGGIERSVKTLSGGESFILSLALALSLSDLASQNVRLDCLFIDEGFGTLDEETLDTVVGTLEKLQMESDKMIGIISHVDSLKDRIITQIKLIKDNQGVSRLEIV